MKKFRNESKKQSGRNIPYTHTMTYEPYGAYDIPEDRYAAFIKLYENAIVAGYQPHIVEKHKEYGPIVIDLDFVQTKENDKRFYTNITIVNIIRLYNRVIKKYLDVSATKMDAYVSEKAQPTLRNEKYHDGLHIVYPYICTKPSLQMMMREDFLKLATKYNLFRKIPLDNTLDEVFDKGVIYHTNWMLYGSVKNPNCHVYRVTHIYNTANGKIFDTLIPGNDINSRTYIKHFINVLSCRRFHSENDITPLADGIDPTDIDQKINKINNKIINQANKKTGEIPNLMGINIYYVKAVSDDLLTEAKKLCKLLRSDRATDYHSWYQVGKCLHNIDHRLLHDWMKFSEKCPKKYQESVEKNEFKTLWRKMKPSHYTIATLHYFAAKDSPRRYQKLRAEKISILTENGLEISHNTIAKLLMEKYKFIYRCASIKHNIWYEFRNHRWIEIDSAYSLRNLISDELTIEYANIQAKLYNDSQGKNGYERKQLHDQADKVHKVIRSLNNSTFKSGVIRECADISYDPNFLKNLDENPNLLCFENGIYDLETGCFRDGCPDDYISLCTGYNYIEADESDEIAIEINDFLKKIQPETEMLDYLMRLLSTCLAGSISEESFYVLTGSGANGKSKIMELLKYTLGEYFKPMDIRLLTEKRGSSSTASPELADKKGIRACPFDEPKATDEINTGFMKIFTGGDMITARALFREPIYFKPQFKPFLLCNHLPNIKSDDDGTWRRLKVIPFNSKFIKQTEATKQMKKHGLPAGYYWADLSISEKLPEWKQVFMSKLIKYYKAYKDPKTGGLIHPKIVVQKTKAYRKKCDVFQDFIGDTLDPAKDAKSGISISALHDSMRTWYRANYDGKCPATKDMRNYMQHRMPTYDPKQDMLMGYCIKQPNNDIDDDLGTL